MSRPEKRPTASLLCASDLSFRERDERVSSQCLPGIKKKRDRALARSFYFSSMQGSSPRDEHTSEMFERSVFVRFFRKTLVKFSMVKFSIFLLLFFRINYCHVYGRLRSSVFIAVFSHTSSRQYPRDGLILLPESYFVN